MQVLIQLGFLWKGFLFSRLSFAPKIFFWLLQLVKKVVLYDWRLFVNWKEYIALLAVVFMLICWRRQEMAYSASDFSRVSLQDSTLRSWEQNAGQDDNMMIANNSFDSDGYSPVCEGPVSIPDQHMWDLWWIKRHWSMISPSLLPCHQYSIFIHLSSTLCSLSNCQGR